MKLNNEPIQILRIVLLPDWSQQTEIRLLDTTVPQQAYAWGVMLADVIRHVARSIEQSGVALDQEEFRQSVRETLNRELTLPDPDMKGGIVKGGPGG